MSPKLRYPTMYEHKVPVALMHVRWMDVSKLRARKGVVGGAACLGLVRPSGRCHRGVGV